MKFKFKPNEDTTLEEIRQELENIKLANIPEIPLNHLRRIIEFLGARQVQATGSSVRFFHPALAEHPYYHGYFQIHKIHKGGDQDLIRRSDYKAILLPALLTIIDCTNK